MKTVFEIAVEQKIENCDVEESIDVLIEEFPKELQDRLWSETDSMDDQTARDYLISKLVERRKAMIPEELKHIPVSMETIVQNPKAVQESLEMAHAEESKYFLGKGQNGQVLASSRQEGVCYKTLFLERAKQLGINITREALMQHHVYEILKKNPSVAQAPEVFGFVKTDDVRAIKMEKLSGFSLAQFLQNPELYVLPEKFDIDIFFQKIEDALQILNEKGYFHRDLNGNAGNIYITSKGDPYIIDFGSAIKSLTPEAGSQVYQLTPNGRYYHGTDISGVRSLKKRLLAQQLSS